MSETTEETDMNQQSKVVAIADQPPKLPNILAGGHARAIVPTDFESAWRIANVIVKSGMAPKDMSTPEQAMVAIMHGLEAGLPPMMALQSIAVINGRPTIWGDGALGLVRSSGLCEYVKEYEEDETAYCEVKRKGEPEPIIRSFSQEDAKKAGLAGKSGPWSTYPRRMRQMRARAWAIRDAFADVLKGLSIREEVDDFVDVTPRAAPAIPTEIAHTRAPEPKVIEHKPQTEHVKGTGAIYAEASGHPQSEAMSPPPIPTTPKDPPKAKKSAPKVSVKAVLKTIDERLASVTDHARLSDVWNEELEPLLKGWTANDREDALAIFREHEARLQPELDADWDRGE